MTTEPDIDAAVERVERFVSHLEARPRSVIVGSGATLHPADLRLLLSALKAEREKVAGLTRERDEADNRWIFRMAAIREASGLGDRPMLDELPAEIGKIAARAQSAEPLLAEAAWVLEPFAEAADHLHPGNPDDGLTLDGVEVRAWRAARTLSAKLKDRQP